MTTLSLTELAYAKLKAHIYGENGSLLLRSQLAEFESSQDFDRKIRALATALDTKDESYFQALLKTVTYLAFPKKISDPVAYSKIITNNPEQDRYSIKKAMYTIECAIEIHLISVLWIMKAGTHLDMEVDPKFSYAHRLYHGELEEHDDHHRKLFVPYWQNYRNWRDNGIEIAKHLHSQRTDCTIVTLDIKNFYYSVDVDLSSLENSLPEDTLTLELNQLLNKVHQRFRSTLNASKNILPIGLLSSGIIANFIMRETDIRMSSELKAAYYGRYVDDFILVLANTAVSVERPLHESLSNILSEYKIFRTDATLGEATLDNSNGDFKIQFDKVRLINLHHGQPLSVLEEFENNIRKTSSEARLLVEHPDLLSRFDTESNKISYSDSVQKLRSVDAFDMVKYGASSYLTNLIESTKITSKVSRLDLDKFHKSAISYFRGHKGIEAFHLWEKVITIYITEDQTHKLFEFVENIFHQVLRLNTAADFASPMGTSSKNQGEPIHDAVSQTLIKWLVESLRIAIALNPKFLKKRPFREYLERLAKSDPRSINAHIKKLTANILTAKHLAEGVRIYRRSNLLRHKYVSLPLANYCRISDDISLSDIGETDISFKLDSHKLRFSPRFLSFSEIQIFSYMRYLRMNRRQQPRPDHIVAFYIRLNRLENRAAQISETFPKRLKAKDSALETTRVRCSSSNFSHSVRLGIANVIIPADDSINAILGEANLHYNRLTELSKILNLAVREKVQLMLFPELTVPIQWIDYLSNFAKKRNIGIITGVEHVKINSSEVANFACHLLPFKADGFTNVFVDLRNKEDFSPDEIEVLRKMKLKPFKGFSEMSIVDWCELHFATFNCFEIADMRKRSRIIGEVDLINIIEHNKDTEYFSNIVQSTSRDVHAIIAQVNNSKFGDSRVCLPAKSFYKDQLRIRGGINSTILVEDINIFDLRLFQQMGSAAAELSKGAEILKPLPPNFKMSYSRRLKTTKRRTS